MTKASFHIFLSDHDTDEHFVFLFFVFNWAWLLIYESIFLVVSRWRNSVFFRFHTIW